jgi:hypothetical protein
MKILFDNLLWSASLSALHENTGYPVTNLRHVFLKKIFKSTAISDTVTIAFASDKIIDSCYLGFTNAASATLTLYNSSMTLLATKTIDIPTLAVSFAAVSGVRYAKIAITATSPALAYLGTAALGEAFTMPDPINDWTPGFVDNSTSEESDDGQYLLNKIPWLRAPVFNFFVESLTDYQEIFDLVAAVERPVFIDPFESNKSMMLPIYGIFSGGISDPVKSDNIFTFSLNVREVR